MSDTTRPRASVGSFGLFWPGFLLLFLFAACSSQLNDSAGAEPGPTVAIETADATATRPGHQVVRATALAERHGVRSIHLYEALEDERNLLGSFEAEDPGDLAPQAHLDFELPADRSVQLEVDAVNGAGSSSSNSFLYEPPAGQVAEITVELDVAAETASREDLSVTFLASSGFELSEATLSIVAADDGEEMARELKLEGTEFEGEFTIPASGFAADSELALSLTVTDALDRSAAQSTLVFVVAGDGDPAEPEIPDVDAEFMVSNAQGQEIRAGEAVRGAFRIAAAHPPAGVAMYWVLDGEHHVLEPDAELRDSLARDDIRGKLLRFPEVTLDESAAGAVFQFALKIDAAGDEAITIMSDPYTVTAPLHQSEITGSVHVVQPADGRLTIGDSLVFDVELDSRYPLSGADVYLLMTGRPPQLIGSVPGVADAQGRVHALNERVTVADTASFPAGEARLRIQVRDAPPATKGGMSHALTSRPFMIQPPPELEVSFTNATTGALAYGAGAEFQVLVESPEPIGTATVELILDGEEKADFAVLDGITPDSPVTEIAETFTIPGGDAFPIGTTAQLRLQIELTGGETYTVATEQVTVEGQPEATISITALPDSFIPGVDSDPTLNFSYDSNVPLGQATVGLFVDDSDEPLAESPEPVSLGGEVAGVVEEHPLKLPADLTDAGSVRIVVALLPAEKNFSLNAVAEETITVTPAHTDVLIADPPANIPYSAASLDVAVSFEGNIPVERARVVALQDGQPTGEREHVFTSPVTAAELTIAELPVPAEAGESFEMRVELYDPAGTQIAVSDSATVQVDPEPTVDALITVAATGPDGIALLNEPLNVNYEASASIDIARVELVSRISNADSFGINDHDGLFVEGSFTIEPERLPDGGELELGLLLTLEDGSVRRAGSATTEIVDPQSDSNIQANIAISGGSPWSITFHDDIPLQVDIDIESRFPLVSYNVEMVFEEREAPAQAGQEFFAEADEVTTLTRSMDVSWLPEEMGPAPGDDKVKFRLVARDGNGLEVVAETSQASVFPLRLDTDIPSTIEHGTELTGTYKVFSSGSMLKIAGVKVRCRAYADPIHAFVEADMSSWDYERTFTVGTGSCDVGDEISVTIETGNYLNYGMTRTVRVRVIEPAP